MKKYGALDAELRDTRRNIAWSSQSTLRVAHLTHYRRQEDYGVKSVDKWVMELRIAICYKSTLSLLIICTALSVLQ